MTNQSTMSDAEVSTLALPPWSDEALAKIREQNKGKNVVCIVGFAPTTRHLALYDDPEVEIWSLNEAHRHQSNYLKRWTRWFQLHKPWDYTKAASPATIDHWEWLRQPHDFPIYMQDVDPQVPASIRYPLDEITEVVLGRTKQWTMDGDEVVKRYFTSSFAYQAALVAYEKLAGIKDWNRVIVVGYEMATWTEFQYQKGSTEFWAGKLDGMGIEVIVPPRCRLLHGGLYGYEVYRVLDRDHLEKLLTVERKKERDQIRTTATASGRREAMEELLKDTIEALKSPLSDEHRMDLEVRRLEYMERGRKTFQDEVEEMRKVNIQFGRSQELDDLVAYTQKAQEQPLSGGNSSPLINRQMLEFRMNSVQSALNQTMQQTLHQRGQRAAYSDLYQKAEFSGRDALQQSGAQAFQRELNSATMTNALTGRREVIIELIRYLDNIDPEDKVLKVLMENDPLQKKEGE